MYMTEVHADHVTEVHADLHEHMSTVNTRVITLFYMTADRRCMEAIARGDVLLQLTAKGKVFTVYNVLVVPKHIVSILSVSQLSSALD